MIGYTMLGTNDLERAAKFYDDVLAPLGGKRAIDNERMVLYANDQGPPMFGVVKPYDGKEASVGNGTMIALNAPSREVVQEVHAKALELGGTDEGAPGERANGFYGGYFRDPDGNKCVAFIFGG